MFYEVPVVPDNAISQHSQPKTSLKTSIISSLPVQKTAPPLFTANNCWIHTAKEGSFISEIFGAELSLAPIWAILIASISLSRQQHSKRFASRQNTET
ncbi:MAG: hypothetical protein WCA08_22070 [Desulfoferrobacter sp.]